MNYILKFNATLAFIAPTAGSVDIDIANTLARFLVVQHRRFTITPSLVVELTLQSRRPLPLRRSLHHPQFAIAPSIAAHCCCALGPSPPRSGRPSPLRSHCAIH